MGLYGFAGIVNLTTVRPYNRMTVKLSDFQRYYGKCREDYGYNPEADGDFRLVYRALGLLEQVLDFGVELRLLRAERVVQRCALEHALLHSVARSELGVPHLHDYAQALYEEYAAQYGQHQLLVDDDCADGYYAADGERAGVAHEDLRRVGVVPEETYERADERTHEHHKLLRARDVHYVEVGGVFYVARHVGEDAQGDAYYGRVAGAHAVHSVVEVGSVRHRRHHEYCHYDEQHPSGGRLVLAEEAHEVGVVEVVPFDERDGGLERLARLGPVFHYHFLPVLLLDGKVFVDFSVGTVPQD